MSVFPRQINFLRQASLIGLIEKINIVFSLPSVSAGLSYDNLSTIEEWLSGENDGLGPIEIIREPGTQWEASGFFN